MAGDRAESLLELAPQEKALLDPNWQREHDCSFHVIALKTAWGKLALNARGFGHAESDSESRSHRQNAASARLTANAKAPDWIESQPKPPHRLLHPSRKLQTRRHVP